MLEFRAGRGSRQQKSVLVGRRGIRAALLFRVCPGLGGHDGADHFLSNVCCRRPAGTLVTTLRGEHNVGQLDSDGDNGETPLPCGYRAIAAGRFLYFSGTCVPGGSSSLQAATHSCQALIVPAESSIYKTGMFLILGNDLVSLLPKHRKTHRENLDKHGDLS